MENTAAFKQFTKKNAEAINAAQTLGHPIASKILNALLEANRAVPETEKKSIEAIEQQRRILSANNNPLIDGSFEKAGLYDGDMAISQACKASMPYFKSIYLYYLVRELQPQTILELGTNLGISSAYLASAAKSNPTSKVVTLEASPYRSRIAKSIHNNLGLNNLSYQVGLFEETLESAVSENTPIDFAFIDGHHQYEPTLDYFCKIRRFGRDATVYLFDDIRWSDGMLKAWHKILADPEVVFAFDFSFYGIVVCSKERPLSNAPVFRIDIRKPRPLGVRVISRLQKMLKMR